MKRIPERGARILTRTVRERSQGVQSLAYNCTPSHWPQKGGRGSAHTAHTKTLPGSCHDVAPLATEHVAFQRRTTRVLSVRVVRFGHVERRASTPIEFKGSAASLRACTEVPDPWIGAHTPIRAFSLRLAFKPESLALSLPFLFSHRSAAARVENRSCCKRLLPPPHASKVQDDFRGGGSVQAAVPPPRLWPQVGEKNDFRQRAALGPAHCVALDRSISWAASAGHRYEIRGGQPLQANAGYDPLRKPEIRTAHKK